MAVGLNFAMMIVALRPAFNLPFRTLKDVTETRDLLATFPLTARKQIGEPGGPEMAPHPPRRSERPGAAGALLYFRPPICPA